MGASPVGKITRLFFERRQVQGIFPSDRAKTVKRLCPERLEITNYPFQGLNMFRSS